MDKYRIGATVPCSVRSEAFNDTSEEWELVDNESEYPKITITKPDGTTETQTALTKIITGKYRYLYTTTGKSAGFYKREYIGKYVSGGETHYPVLVDGFWLE